MSFLTQRLMPLFVLLFVLAACSPGGETESSAPAEATAPGGVSDGVVNVYSSRHYDTDDELYDRFTRETGIEVNLIEADSAALLERLEREDEESPADIFMAVDAGRLTQAAGEGIFQPVSSSALEANVPEHLRHPEGLWFGLTKRARVIVYATDRVNPEEITTYEDLADPKWKDRVVIRSSTNVYNQSLVASIIAALGEEEAEAWCEGIVANFARTPQGGDRDQIRAIAAGEGDVGVVNTYYLARMIAGSEEDQEAAAGIGIIFPNQGGRGTHVNISGAGIVRGAPNKDNAVRFLEYLTGPEAQAMLAEGGKEYPVAGSPDAVPELAVFGAFEEDTVNAAVFGEGGQPALMLMDRCGWR